MTEDERREADKAKHPAVISKALEATILLERDGMKATFNPGALLVLVYHDDGHRAEWYRNPSGELSRIRGFYHNEAIEAERALVQAIFAEVDRRNAALTPHVHKVTAGPIDQPLDPQPTGWYSRAGTGNRRRTQGRRVTDVPNTAEVLAGFRDAVEAAGITKEQMTDLIIELGARGLTVTSDQQAAHGAPST